MSTYDPNRNRPVNTNTDYTGWIIGAIVVVAIVIGVFVWGPWGNGGGDNQTAATTPATTSAPANRETTGVGGAPARAPASAPASTPANTPAPTPPAANR